MNESIAMMANHGEDIDNIDFGMLVTDKEVVDDDEEEREKIIEANRLYQDRHQAKVGASGASVRTGASGASSVMSEARSSSSANVRHGYRVKSLDLAKEKGKTAALEAALRAAGIDPNNISGIAKRSEIAGSLEGESESEEESATKTKSRGTTALKNSEGTAQKRGVQFQKLPDGK